MFYLLPNKRPSITRLVEFNNPHDSFQKLPVNYCFPDFQFPIGAAFYSIIILESKGVSAVCPSMINIDSHALMQAGVYLSMAVT
jgi:hypothetical protein